jgi:hypothetical protein
LRVSTLVDSQVGFKFKQVLERIRAKHGTSRLTGNITNAPLFVSLTGGDFHLQPTSPCINSGYNAVVAGTTTSTATRVLWAAQWTSSGSTGLWRQCLLLRGELSGSWRIANPVF